MMSYFDTTVLLLLSSLHSSVPLLFYSLSQLTIFHTILTPTRRLQMLHSSANFSGTRPEMTYMADAISANTQLTETYFNSLHKYRLEWMPGEEGYIRWYLDDEFIYGIRANALNKTGAIIPEEPMYLLLNTAISSTWGFPQVTECLHTLSYPLTHPIP